MLTIQRASQREKPSLDRLVQRIDHISTLPQIALRVMEVANDPDSGAIDLKKVIETDPALSARILRCVNSSAFARRTKTSSLQEAIGYLGLKQIRNLAVTASVSKLFQGKDGIGPYCRSQLWRHLVSVGICARLIAMRRRMSNFEEAFLGGLLHDIGIVLEDQYAHEPFAAAIHSLDGADSLIEAERNHLGFDHAELGNRIAAAWRFPEATRVSIRCHHGSAGYRSEHINVVRCVEVANLICTLKGISSVGLKLVKVSQPALAGLSLTGEDIKILAEDLDGELAASASLFQI
jgi:putative nucleotidyltransferase with HDIG domain